MRLTKSTITLLLFFLLSGTGVFGQNVIEDEGVGMTAQELEFIVRYWTPQMRQSAAVDMGDRYELLNMALANKKIALEAKKFTPEDDPDHYWANQLVIRNTERKFVVDNYIANLKIPDMSELAAERYLTAPDKYALVPESRKVSHILFRCEGPDCDREALRKDAAQVLAQLESGANFEAMAQQYSGDPGSKDKGGKFDKWLQTRTENVEPYFLQGVFAIDEVGDYSPLVDSQFGIHIIRLDEVREKSHLPFEEAKGAIVAELRQEYKVLAAKEFDARFRLTDETYIDKAAMEEIFSQYDADGDLIKQ
tara:strand:- start:86648 stop:87568 length:921 start_codon:yes stop_codon:yes gene_type:complete